MNLYYHAWRLFLRAAVPTLTGIDVRGLDLVPRTGPLILVSNHLSMTDPVILLRYVKRHVHFMTKAELFDQFPTSILLPPGAPIKVHRGKVDRVALRQAETFLKA